MLRSYIIVALRNLWRNRGFAAINIFGLAIGLASSIFILLYVLFELSFDNYHQDVDGTYVVGLESTSENGRSVSGGNMLGRRLASMVLPAPGGPIISTLWWPAAAMRLSLNVRSASLRTAWTPTRK